MSNEWGPGQDETVRAPKKQYLVSQVSQITSNTQATEGNRNSSNAYQITSPHLFHPEVRSEETSPVRQQVPAIGIELVEDLRPTIMQHAGSHDQCL